MHALLRMLSSLARTSMAGCTLEATTGFGGGRASSAKEVGGSDLANLFATSRAPPVASPEDDPVNRGEAAPLAELTEMGDDQTPFARSFLISTVDASSGPLRAPLLRRLKDGFITVAELEIRSLCSSSGTTVAGLEMPSARAPGIQPTASPWSFRSRSSCGVSRVVSRRVPGDLLMPCSEAAGRTSRRDPVLGLTRGPLPLFLLLKEEEGELLVLLVDAENGDVAPTLPGACAGVRGADG